jgi:hypothetical protein
MGWKPGWAKKILPIGRAWHGRKQKSGHGWSEDHTAAYLGHINTLHILRA